MPVYMAQGHVERTPTVVMQAPGRGGKKPAPASSSPRAQASEGGVTVGGLAGYWHANGRHVNGPPRRRITL